VRPSKDPAGARTRPRCRCARPEAGGLPHLPPHGRVAAFRAGPQRRAGATMARPPLAQLHARHVCPPARPRSRRAARSHRRCNRSAASGQRWVNTTSENSREGEPRKARQTRIAEPISRTAASRQNPGEGLITRRSRVRIPPPLYRSLGNEDSRKPQRPEIESHARGFGVLS
jgi:hypothetical protein